MYSRHIVVVVVVAFAREYDSKIKKISAS